MSRISDETIEYTAILAKLELSETEKEQAKKELEQMIDYVDLLQKLDTGGVLPMFQSVPVQNVFREDIVTNTDGQETFLSGAPEQKNGMLSVPGTIRQEG